MKLRTHVWNQLCSPEIAEAQRAGAVVLIPTGATEQHGAHLPMDIDILAATTVAMRAAEQVEDFPVLVANVSHVGFSPECMEHPGTLSLRLETFVAMMQDVVKCIHGHGFRKIMAINGHGGNIPPLRAAAWQLTTDGYPLVIVTYWELIVDEQSRFLCGPIDHIRHACEFETSMMLHMRPDGVAMDKAVNCLHPPWNPKLERDPLRGEGVFFPSVFRKSGPGLVGAPTYAKPETGERLLNAAAAKLAKVVRTFRDTDIGQ
jgi:creatinine amidohydrolase